MKIGIDCHNLEGNRTGVGRYVWNLLKQIPEFSIFPPTADPFGRSAVGMRDFPQGDNFQFSNKLFLYFKNEVPDDVGNLARNQEWITRKLSGRSNAFFKHWVLPRAVKRDCLDVLFCPDYVLPIYVGGRVSHIRTAVTIHDIIYEARPKEYSWPSIADKILLKWASKRSAKKADIIFVPSEFTRNEIIKYYKVNPEKIVVTPLAPDPIFRKLNFSDGKMRQEWEDIKSRYGIQDKFIFFIGSIFNRRFLPQEIEAFENFAKTREDWQFLIIGENHTRPYQDIRTMVDAVNGALGRKAVIWQRYIGDDKELVYLYNKAHATLWLSSYEGFGLPVLESMACGTPVITSKSGSLPEIAQDAALYIEDPGNPEEIEGVLSHLVNQEDSYKELAGMGISHSEKFSWKRTAENTLDNLV